MSSRATWRSIALPLLFQVAVGVPAELGATAPQQRGIALGLFSADPEQRYAAYLDEIVAQGASHVSLVTVWYQHDIRASEIRPRPGFTPSDANLRRTLEAARERGLRVMLFPILGIEERGAKEWRGKLQPADWDRWFASYQAYIEHMAKIAAEHSVEVLSVGSELLTTEPQRQRWLPLLKRVRELYPGKLLYSANWDHFEPVSFWDQVDLMGVTGYYELTKSREPELGDLVQRWRVWQAPLLSQAKKIGKPLVFTEIGYPALDGCNIYPWDETRKAALDVEEQALCYRAFVTAWDAQPLLHGVFFWNWFGPGGPQDRDYTPRGKPAAQIIQDWYAQPGVSGKPSQGD